MKKTYLGKEAVGLIYLLFWGIILSVLVVDTVLKIILGHGLLEFLNEGMGMWELGVLSFGLVLWILFVSIRDQIPVQRPFPLKGSHQAPPDPLISVVIPAFNEAYFLAGTLQSLLDQDFKLFEILVVDNGSTDATAEIAKRFGSRVIHERRKGVAQARQSGFEASKAPIVVTTDADTIFSSDWLSRIASKFEKNYDLSGYGGLYTLYSGPLASRIALRYFSYFAWTLDRKYWQGWSLPGCNLAVRKADFFKVGGFNTSLTLFEDADLSQRLSTVGKVELDRTLYVQTSGRRFRYGFLFGMLVYIRMAVARVFLKSCHKIEFKDVRKEASFQNLEAFMLLLFPILFFILTNLSVTKI